MTAKPAEHNTGDSCPVWHHPVLKQGDVFFTMYFDHIKGIMIKLTVDHKTGTISFREIQLVSE